ncbi:MAG: hypothetical protein N2C14_20040 [Planctomycetales bacterium]
MFKFDSTTNDFAWSPDGTILAAAGGSGSVHLVDITQSKVLPPMGGHACGVRQVAWSRDGRRIASGDKNGIIKIWDAASHDEMFTIAAHSSAVESLEWSPDSHRLLSSDAEGAVRIWGSERMQKVDGDTALPTPKQAPKRPTNSSERRVRERLKELTTAIGAESRDPKLLKQRADVLMKLQDWEKAAADWEASLQGREHLWGRGNLALTYAMLGKDEQYHAHARKLIAKIDGWDKGVTSLGGNVASLLPGVMDDYSPVLRAVENHDSASSDPRWGQQRLGLLYRMRQYDELLRLAAKMESEKPQDAPFRVATQRLWRAMAYHQGEQAQEARTSLEAAVKLMENNPPEPGGHVEYPIPWIQCQVLRKEAEELILGGKPKPTDTSKEALDGGKDG